MSDHEEPRRPVNKLLDVHDKTTLDNIRAYLWDPEVNAEKITAHMKEVLIRLRKAHNLLFEFKLNKKVAELLCSEYKYSMSTGYRDIAAAKLIFGVRNDATKEYDRHLYIAWLRESALRAQTAGDYMAESRLLSQAIKLEQFDKPEAEDDGLREAPPTFIIQNNPELVGGKRIKNLDERISRFKHKRRQDSLGVEEAQIISEESEES
jgi:hypothetical protein